MFQGAQLLSQLMIIGYTEALYYRNKVGVMKSKDKDTRMQGGGQISQNNSSILQNINYIMGLLCKTSWQMLKFIYIYDIEIKRTTGY